MKSYIAVSTVAFWLVACTHPQESIQTDSAPTHLSSESTLPVNTAEVETGSNSEGKILIQKQRDYYIANPDGSNPILLFSGGESPLSMASLSAEASQFAYYKDNYVYIQGIETQQTRVINTEILGNIGGQLRWSPDGKELAMSCSNAQQPTSAICLIDTADGHIDFLINENNTDAFCSSSYIELLDWSRDGSIMVYLCFSIPEKGQKEMFSIYLYDFMSKTSRNILDGSIQDTLWSVQGASISPDKNHLLLNGSGQEPNQQVFTLDLAANTLMQLTSDNNLNATASAWRRDGRTFYLHQTQVELPYNESNFVMDIFGQILFAIEINGTVIQ